MKVSELSKRSGVASSAIRFYEAEGILPAAKRSASGYRDYDEADVCRVRVLSSLRSLGLEIREAARLAELCSSGHCDTMAEHLLPQLALRRSEIERARVELDHLDRTLAQLETTIRNGGIELGLQGKGVCCAPDDQACCGPT